MAARRLATGRLSTEKLVTHTIQPEGIGQAYEGLLKEKDAYLGRGGEVEVTKASGAA